MPKAPLCEYASSCACVCLFKIFSETIRPTEAKFHVEPQWIRGRKFIQKIPVICCSSFEYCQPLGAGAFRKDFTTNVAPQCRALEIEKLKAPLFHGPEGAGDTISLSFQKKMWDKATFNFHPAIFAHIARSQHLHNNT